MDGEYITKVEDLDLQRLGSLPQSTVARLTFMRLRAASGAAVEHAYTTGEEWDQMRALRNKAIGTMPEQLSDEELEEMQMERKVAKQETAGHMSKLRNKQADMGWRWNPFHVWTSRTKPQKQKSCKRSLESDGQCSDFDVTLTLANK
jgi:hypothetical protein